MFFIMRSAKENINEMDLVKFQFLSIFVKYKNKGINSENTTPILSYII